MRATAAILVAASILMGCSDSSLETSAEPDETATTDDTTAETTSTTTEPEPDPERDQATAEEIVLTIDDLGPEWHAFEADDLDGGGFDDDLAACLGVTPDELFRDAPTAYSGTFQPGDDRSVEADVTVAASTAEAEEFVDTYRSDVTVQCLADLHRDVIVDTFTGPDYRDDLVVGETVTERRDIPEFGDEQIALRFTFPITAPGLDAPIHADLILTRVGRVFIASAFANTLSPFPEADALDLVAVMVDRVPADV